MIFLHNSLNSDKFKNDRKLDLLKKNIITVGQFINLIDGNDEYVMFGPAIIDKEKIEDFVKEWKNHQINGDSIENRKAYEMTQEQITDRFRDIVNVFPELSYIADDYEEEISNAICPKCTRSHYITSMVVKIKNLLDSGDDRDMGSMKEFINLMILKYTNNQSGPIDENKFDVEWIKPETLVGIGNDLIDKLDSCFECVIKHIGRAKILYEESLLGYPDHKSISFDELSKGNKNLEQLYMKYLDSCSQLDMGSSELIGDMKNLNPMFVGDIIELANEIRRQRILFQEDAKNVPDFDDLRLKVKKMELKVKESLLNK